jgi:hypothetical protein
MDQRFIELCQLAVPGILSRMQGQPINSVEKKEKFVAPDAELQIRYGSVALFLISLCNFLSDSLICENFGPALCAFS